MIGVVLGKYITAQKRVKEKEKKAFFHLSLTFNK